jgi:hypothetical protein
MSTNKIVIIVLVVIAILFAIGIGFGVKNDREPTADDEKCSPQWAKMIGSLFNPLRPKLQLDRKSFSVPSSKSQQITVPPDKNAFRIASFRLKAGSGVKIDYNREDEPLELPRDTCKKDKKDDPKQGSLAIFKEGGFLTITCIGNRNCKIELE